MTASAVPPQGDHSLTVLEQSRELLLVVVTASAVFSLDRLFVGGFLGPVLLHTVVAHAVVAAARRRGLGLAPAAVLTAVAAVLAISWLHYADTTAALLPTGTTLDALGSDLGDAWSLFADVRPPVEPELGFLVASALAVWVSAFIADWAAFRVAVPFEAVLPAATIVVFAALLDRDGGGIPETALATAAGLTFLLVHRINREAHTGHWVTAHRRRGIAALLVLGLVLGGGAVGAAALVGPDLPGAESEALVNLRGGDDGPSSRITVSPLVDIHRRLVDQSEVEVFTVQSDVRSYWRLTSLDTFDGRIWSSSGSYGRADGSLPRNVEPATTSETVTQEYTITGLADIWLPAAFEPRAVESELDVRYNEESSTLIVDTDIATSDGFVYQVESAAPRFDPEALAQAPQQMPSHIAETYLALPPDFSPMAADVAREVTRGAGSPYDAARRMQDWFQAQFTYDLFAPTGHSGNDLERFLQDRRGYCEQFAGAYAAMARSLGLPARVAVGFTPGEEVEPGRYVVRGRHAHAWPEVYLAGEGWVLFEPTPGRGAPFAESYTGLPEQQADANDPTTATTLTPTTVAPSGDPADAPERNDEVDAIQPDLGEPILPDGGTTGSAWADRLLWASAAILGLALAYLIGVPSLRALRRRRRRHLAETPRDRVGVAWEESLDELAGVGFVAPPTDTHAEAGARAAAHLRDHPELPLRLAGLAEEAVYAPTALDEADADEAEALAGEITELVRASMTRQQRMRRVLDPRPLLAGADRRRSVSTR